MKNKYRKHVFVCTNKRNPSIKQSCGQIGTPLRIELKRAIGEKNLNHRIRINSSGCLGKCSLGPCFVIYPEGKWEFNAKLEDSGKIINKLIEEEFKLED